MTLPPRLATIFPTASAYFPYASAPPSALNLSKFSITTGPLSALDMNAASASGFGSNILIPLLPFVSFVAVQQPLLLYSWYQGLLDSASTSLVVLTYRV